MLEVMTTRLAGSGSRSGGSQSLSSSSQVSIMEEGQTTNRGQSAWKHAATQMACAETAASVSGILSQAAITTLY